VGILATISNKATPRRALTKSGHIVLAVAAAIMISACGNKEENTTTAAHAETAASVVVKIGSVAPLTGTQAHLGKDNDNGARLAIDEINAAGYTIAGKKITFQLVSEDDQADPKTATIVAQKLVDQKVRGVVGHLNSGTTIPASKIYHDAGVAQISPSATAVMYTAQGFNTAFRVMANDSRQGGALGKFAAKQLAAKSIAIIDDRTAYGQGLADEFERVAKAHGVNIVGREYTTDKSADFFAILTSIKGKKPDIIFFGGMDAQAAPMIKQMKTLGLTAQLLGGDGLRSAEFTKLAGVDAEGVIASSPGVALNKMPGGKEFIAKFETKYGKIQIYAPYAYDAVHTLVEAMKHADSIDPVKYLPELAKTDRNGITGRIIFDEKGDIKNGAVTLYQIKGGDWVELEAVSGH